MRISPKTFVSNCLRALSIGTDSTAPLWLYPALLTSAPIEPPSCSTCSTALAIELSSLTSSASVLAPDEARSESVSGLRAVAYTFQPSATRR